MSAKSIASSLAALTWLAFHMAGSPAGSALDQLERAVRRPLPPVPPPAVSRPLEWVPGRWVDTPAGPAHVPGHWEERRSAREFLVPPEAACTAATGNCVFVPGGVRRPAMERQGP